MEKTIDQFSIKRSRPPAPSIEVDEGSIYGDTFQDCLEKALSDYATEHPDKKGSIYTYFTASTNFLSLTNSVFYIVPGAQELLQKNAPCSA